MRTGGVSHLDGLPQTTKGLNHFSTKSHIVPTSYSCRENRVMYGLTERGLIASVVCVVYTWNMHTDVIILHKLGQAVFGGDLGASYQTSMCLHGHSQAILCWWLCLNMCHIYTSHCLQQQNHLIAFVQVGHMPYYPLTLSILKWLQIPTLIPINFCSFKSTWG